MDWNSEAWSDRINDLRKVKIAIMANSDVHQRKDGCQSLYSAIIKLVNHMYDVMKGGVDSVQKAADDQDNNLMKKVLKLVIDQRKNHESKTVSS